MEVSQLAREILALHKANNYYPGEGTLAISLNNKSEFVVTFGYLGNHEPQTSNANLDVALEQMRELLLTQLEDKQKQSDKDHQQTQNNRQQLINRYRNK